MDWTKLTSRQWRELMIKGVAFEKLQNIFWDGSFMPKGHFPRLSFNMPLLSELVQQSWMKITFRAFEFCDLYVLDWLLLMSRVELSAWSTIRHSSTLSGHGILGFLMSRHTLQISVLPTYHLTSLRQASVNLIESLKYD